MATRRRDWLPRWTATHDDVPAERQGRRRRPLCPATANELAGLLGSALLRATGRPPRTRRAQAGQALPPPAAGGEPGLAVCPRLRAGVLARRQAANALRL